LAGNTHGGSPELINRGGGRKSGLKRDVPVAVSLDQGGGHRPVFWRLGVLHEINKLRSSAVANPLACGGLVFDVFSDKKQFFCYSRDKLLGEDADQLDGKKGGCIFPLFRTKDAVKALNGFGGAAAVKGGEDKMACFCCLEGGAGGGGIPNFPKKYNVWALAEGAS
jgi:hypothetical protein